MTQPAVPAGVVIEVPTPNNVILHIPGPQGPAGVQNVVVSPTPPTNPFLNLIWIDTS